MISLSVDENFVPDLHDDFVMNKVLSLYDFVDGNVVKAFYLGYNISNWIEDLDNDQKYLHTKLIRHNKDDLNKYIDQINFWANKFEPDSKKEINYGLLAEYVLNNIIMEKEDEDKDLVKLAFYFGSIIKSSKNDKD
jgi:hypothetical protein